MSLIALILICSTLLLIVSQFGSRLAARNSIVWWTVTFFIALAAIHPDIFRPLTDILGIEIVSNFVLATLILFLFLQLLELTTETTMQSRKMRLLVASFSADDYFKANSKLKQTPEESPLKILVLLPCYNEEDALEDTIMRIESLRNDIKNSNILLKVCFVNDGSMDASARILAERCPDSFVSHRVNVGVAGVLLTGFEIGKRLDVDYVVQCDSDGQHPISKIPDIVAHAHRGQFDLVIGSRFAQKNVDSIDKSTTAARLTGIQVIRGMLRIFGQNACIFDPTSGFRVYSRKGQTLLSKQMPDEYPEPESIAILAIRRCKIGEYPVEMLPRTTGVSSINGFKSLRFMVKVLSALLGLRLRTLVSGKKSLVV